MNRTLDLLISGLALIVVSPLMVLVALANWALTRRVLFRQERLGRALRPFTILKFQTMTDEVHGASTVTVASDRRVTPVGHLLRAAKIDELPQLINVLRGEMSLVGPRALTPNEVAHVPREVAARVYSVRPGMTGVASLLFSDEERTLAGTTRPEDYYFDVILPRKMALESVYVQRKSFWVDVRILALTPLAIVFPGVARRYLQAMITVRKSSLTAKESM